jgi:hypothetical protein
MQQQVERQQVLAVTVQQHSNLYLRLAASQPDLAGRLLCHAACTAVKPSDSFTTHVDHTAQQLICAYVN